jgi:hypothetical protein
LALDALVDGPLVAPGREGPSGLDGFAAAAGAIAGASS